MTRWDHGWSASPLDNPQAGHAPLTDLTIARKVEFAAYSAPRTAESIFKREPNGQMRIGETHGQKKCDLFEYGKVTGEARAIFHDLRLSLSLKGLCGIAYFTIRPANGLAAPIYLSNYPDDWLDRYDIQRYELIDPVLHRAAKTILPFRWNELLRAGAINAQQRRFLGEAADFGLSRGIAIPLHGPRNGLTALSLYADKAMSAKEFNDLWQGMRHDIRLQSMHAHQLIVDNAYMLCQHGQHTIH